MTHAICVKCGARKFGILLACKSCGGVVSTELERTYAFVYSDHFLDEEQLREISASIMAGEPLPRLPPEQEEQFRGAYGGGNRSTDIDDA